MVNDNGLRRPTDATSSAADPANARPTDAKSAARPKAARHSDVFTLEGEAHSLADRLPDLLVEAMRISTTVAHGIHGRRRAGTGETFWQFRQFGDFDAATLIDWRRSASSDHLFVREREWEAAHTIWLWPDLSPSMVFKSHLSTVTKRDRALVLTLALAELLVRGGERVALIGLTRPSASRRATTAIAEAIAVNAATPLLRDSLPPPERLSRYSGAILVSDFLDPVAPIAERMALLAGNGVSGHVVQILDPAEETLPYSGRAEFIGVEGPERWTAEKAETLRTDYVAALAAHRAELEETTRRLGWSFLVHHTDRPAAEPLLALMMRLGNAGGSGQDYRWTSNVAAGASPTSAPTSPTIGPVPSAQHGGDPS